MSIRRLVLGILLLVVSSEVFGQIGIGASPSGDPISPTADITYSTIHHLGVTIQWKVFPAGITEIETTKPDNTFRVVWDVPIGTTSATVTSSYSYNGQIYRRSLVVNFEHPCTKPTISFSSSVSSACSGETYHFIANPSEPYSSINWPDGGTAYEVDVRPNTGGKEADITFTSSGGTSVSVTVANKCGTATATIPVNVRGLPKLDNSCQDCPTTICEGSTGMFKVSPNAITEYMTWDLSEGVSEVWSNSPRKSEMELLFEDAGTKPITVTPHTTYCSGEPYTFSVQVSDQFRVDSVTYSHQDLDNNNPSPLHKSLSFNGCNEATSTCTRTVTKLDLYARLNAGESHLWGNTDFSVSGNFDVRALSSTGTELFSRTIAMNINKDNVEQLYHEAFTSNLADIATIEITPVANSYVTTGLVDPSQVSLSFYYTDEEAIDVSAADITLLSPAVANPPTTISGVWEYTFAWQIKTSSHCFEVPNYEFQLIRQYGSEAVVWDHALKMYTDSSVPEITVAIAEGSGVYKWRVRPVGSLSGGITNPSNWSEGQWREGSFVYINPDEQKNWIYSRTFTEGNKVSQQLTFANGLQQVKQQQTKVSDRVVATQTLQDYTGRDVLSTLPVPLTGTDNQLGYKDNLIIGGYAKSVYDQDPKMATAMAFTSPYYSAAAVEGTETINEGVASANGFPYTRTVFTNDGTGRVKEQSGVGADHRIGSGHTVRTYYSGASESEMLMLFGEEAPDSANVHKITTFDANGTSSITYQNKDGKVLATALSVGSGGASLLPLESDAITIYEYIGGGTQTGPFLQTTRKPLLFTTPRDIDITYEITPSMLSEICGVGCRTCDYRIEIVMHTLNPIPGEPASRLLGAHDIDMGTACATNATVTVPVASFSAKAETEYVLEKRVITNNTIAGQGLTYLEQYINEEISSYQTSIDGSLEAILSYLTNKDIEGLKAYLIANYSSDDDGYYIIPVLCDENIRIQLPEVCEPEPVADAGTCTWQGNSLADYFNVYWSERPYNESGDIHTVADLFVKNKLTGEKEYFTASGFDQLISNIYNENSDVLSCQTIWETWRGQVASYGAAIESFKDISVEDEPDFVYEYVMVQDFINALEGTLVANLPEMPADEILACVEGTKSYFTRSNSDLYGIIGGQTRAFDKTRAHAMVYYDEGNDSDESTKGLRYYFNHLLGQDKTYKPTLSDYTGLTQCDRYKLSQGGQAIDPSQGEGDKEKYRLKAISQCGAACEARSENFRQGIIRSLVVADPAVKIQHYEISPVDFITDTDSIKYVGIYDTLVNDTIYDYSECELDAMVEALVQNCKDNYCQLDFWTNPLTGLEELGLPDQLTAMKQIYTHDFEVEVKGDSNGCGAGWQFISGGEDSEGWKIAKTLFSGALEYPSINRDLDGNFYLYGKVDRTIEFPNGEIILDKNGLNIKDFLIMKISPTGELIWKKFFETVQYSTLKTTSASKLAESSDSFVVNEENYVSLDPVSGDIVFKVNVAASSYRDDYDYKIFADGKLQCELNDLSDTYISKISTDGNISWVKPMTGWVSTPFYINGEVYFPHMESSSYGLQIKKLKSTGDIDTSFSGDILTWNSEAGLGFAVEAANIIYKDGKVTLRWNISNVDNDLIIYVNGVEKYRTQPSGSGYDNWLWFQFDVLGNYLKTKSMAKPNVYMPSEKIINSRITGYIHNGFPEKRTVYWEGQTFVIDYGETLYYQLGDDLNLLNTYMYKHDLISTKTRQLPVWNFNSQNYFYSVIGSTIDQSIKVIETNVSLNTSIVNDISFYDRNYGSFYTDFLGLFKEEKYYTLFGYSSQPTTFGSIVLDDFSNSSTFFASYLNNGKCSAPNLCFKWTTSRNFDISIDGAYNPQPKTCQEIETESILQDVNGQRQSLIDTRRDSLRDQYTNQCVKNLNDQLAIKHDLGTHHFTLYYYDRAGNLIQTVPPEGVRPLNVGTPAAIVSARTTEPQHEMVTSYHYNSLGQMVWQNTPDAGETQFVYNDIGQLRFSINSQQKADGNCSYTKYDRLGRITEVGQAAEANLQVLRNKRNDPDYPASGEQITRTVYTDNAPASILTGLTQRYLQNRVSYTYLDDDGSAVTLDDRTYTIYSYDPHGNVEWLVQNVPGLGEKLIKYEYDLLSGNVLQVSYNPGSDDEFYHKYEYDADNRITGVFTSRDGYLWDKDASYEYYAHGPLKRAIIGEDSVQNLDYVYTIHGWLKAINNPASMEATGAKAAADAFAMSLNYYNGDYQGVNTTIAGVLPAEDSRDLYNGNISAWEASNRASDNFWMRTGMQYTYDELNRIRVGNFNVFRGNQFYTRGGFHSDYTYDANGNLKTLNRNDIDAEKMDALVYHQYKNAQNQGINRLSHVQDFSNIEPDKHKNDIEYQNEFNYTYDNIGNLTSDAQADMAIDWTVYGKVRATRKGDGTLGTAFKYDAAGNRVVKKTVDENGNIVTDFYVRDASGNIMAVYKTTETDGNAKTELQEVPIYGSDRLGVYKPAGSFANNNAITSELSEDKQVNAYEDVSYNLEENVKLTLQPGFVFEDGKDGNGFFVGTASAEDAAAMENIYTRTLDKKQYELKDHLGNVRTVITDRKLSTIDGTTPTDFRPSIASASSYYPFGMDMPTVQWDTTEYLATMEADFVLDEVGEFENYIEFRTNNIVFNHTDDEGAGTYSQTSMISNGQVGLAKSLKVQAGDKINAEVYGKYVGGEETVNPLQVMGLLTASFAQAFNLPASYEGSVTTDLLSGVLPGSEGLSKSGEEGEVFVYLNYILFDENFEVVTAGFKRLSSAAEMAHERLSFDDVVPSEEGIVITKDGYAYVYLSNESVTSKVTEVHFDDFKITHEHLAEDEGYNSGLIAYRYGFNGKEKDQNSEWTNEQIATSRPINVTAYYPLDGDAEDKAPNALKGYLEGGATATTDRNGNEGKALLFDGVDDKVTINHNELLYSEDLTVSAWIKAPAQSAGGGVIVGKHQGGTSSSINERGWLMSTTMTEPENRLQVIVSEHADASKIKIYRSSQAILDNQWHHVAFTFADNELKLYIDGQEDVNVTKYRDDVVNVPYTNTADLTIGWHVASGVDSRFFKGAIDEVGIFDRVFSAADIAALADDTNPLEISRKEMMVAGRGLNNYDYGARIYNPGIGRWLSVDPLAVKYPFLSPYHAMNNSPTWFLDNDGKENIIYIYLGKEFEKTAISQGLDIDIIKNEIKQLLTAHGIEGGTVDVVFSDQFIPARELDHSDSFVFVGMYKDQQALLPQVHNHSESDINYPKNLPTKPIGTAGTTEGIDVNVYELSGFDVTENSGAMNERRFILINGGSLLEGSFDLNKTPTLLNDADKRLSTIIVHELHHGGNAEHTDQSDEYGKETIFERNIDDVMKQKYMNKSNERTRNLLKQNFKQGGKPTDNREKYKNRKSDEGSKYN